LLNQEFSKKGNALIRLLKIKRLTER